MDDETRYRILKILEEDPGLSQRGLARKLGISVGKANYCLKGLIEKGLVKAANFRQQKNKASYMYLLTPKGIREKALVTMRFLRRKELEYEALVRELEELRRESAAVSAFSEGDQ